MNVWSFEATEITDTVELDEKPIYHTPDIREFLQFNRSPKRIISGLKGTGKTLFLKLISHQCRRAGGFVVVPTTQLTERLYSLDYEFSEKEIEAWSSTERWKHIWRTVLSVVVLRATNYPLSPLIDKLFPESLGLSIGAHLSAAVKIRTSQVSAFQELFPEQLDAPIQALDQPVALFIDNIDEAMARHAGSDLLKGSSERLPQIGAQSYQFWLAAQIGFVLATRELCGRSRHLKIYGTVRSEAIRDNPLPVAFNIHGLVLDLQYSKDDLRGMFATKLQSLRTESPHLFVRQEVSDPICAFFAQDTIQHRTVTSRRGAPLAEDVFEYVRRHTRGRPRELDFIGHRLQAIPAVSRNEQAVRDIVRELSSQFFLFARNEAAPWWEPALDFLLDDVSSNFVSRERALARAAKNVDRAEAERLFTMLHANGLCGAVIHVHGASFEQRFAHHDNQCNLSLQDFCAAHTWIIHPCVNIATASRRVRYTPNRQNVAGHALAFVKMPRPQKKHLHVLVGAGRLGLGLVAPVVLADSGTALLIIARNFSGRWDGLAEGTAPVVKDLEVRYESRTPVTGREVQILKVGVVSDDAPDWKTTLRVALARRPCALLLVGQEVSFNEALALADSVGFSVGALNIEAVARSIAAAAPIKARLAFAYENDERMVASAANILREAGITVVPTVVDRVCSNVRIDTDRVVISVEPYGRMSAQVTPRLARRAPTCFRPGDHADSDVLTTDESFAFVRERKKRLVNGLQAAAAALALRMLRAESASARAATDNLFGVLAGNMDIQAQLVGLKEVMILVVLSSTQSLALRGDALATEIDSLLHYADTALHRMTSAKNSVARVLQDDTMSLISKWERLFDDVEERVQLAYSNPDLRKYLDIDEKEVKARLAALTNAFFKLVSASEKQKRNSQKVKRVR